MKFNPGIETPYYSKHTKNQDNRVNGCDGTAAQMFRCLLLYISVAIKVTDMKKAYSES